MWNVSEITLLLYGISFVTVTPVLLYFIALKGSTVERILQAFVLFILLAVVSGVVYEPFISNPFEDFPFHVDDFNEYVDSIQCDWGYYEEDGICVEYVVEQPDADGTAQYPYVIKNEYDLELMREYPNSYFHITDDIELSEEYVPIPEFNGVLYGNGFTISSEDLSNMNTSFNRGYLGFISVNKGEIYSVDINVSLYIDDTQTLDSLYVGGLVAYNRGTIIDVNGITTIHVDSTTVSYIGGVIGYSDIVTTAEVLDFNTESHIYAHSTEDLYVGGAIGYTRNTVYDMYTTSYIEAITDTVSYVGGNVGYVDRDVVNLTSFGTVESNGNIVNIGGNVGKVGAKVAHNSFSLVNNANVRGEAIDNAYIGGNIGYSYFADLHDLRNFGDVLGFLSDGNIGGNVGYSDFRIAIATNFGEVFTYIQETENEDAIVTAGGVVGYAELLENTHFNGQINIYNYDDCDFILGGLTGHSLEISNSYIDGTITVQQSGTNSKIGGVAGINNTFMKNVIYRGKFVGWEMDFTEISKLAAQFGTIENVYIINNTVHVCDDVSLDDLLTDQEVVSYIELNDIFSTDFKNQLGWNSSIWDLSDYVLK